MSTPAVTHARQDGASASALSKPLVRPTKLELLKSALSLLDFECFDKIPKEQRQMLDQVQLDRLIKELDLPPLPYSRDITFINGRERVVKKVEFPYKQMDFLVLLFQSLWEVHAIDGMYYKGGKGRQVVLGKEESPEDSDFHISIRPKAAALLQLVFSNCLAKHAKITFRDDSSKNVRIYLKDGKELGRISPIPPKPPIKSLSGYCGHFFITGGGLENRFCEESETRKHSLYSLAVGDRKCDFHFVAQLENLAFCSSKSMQVALHPLFYLMVSHGSIKLSSAPEYAGTDVFYVKTVDGYPLKTVMDHVERREFSIEPAYRAKTLSKGLLIFLRMLTAGDRCNNPEIISSMEEKFRKQYYQYKKGAEARIDPKERRYVRGQALQRDLRIEMQHIKDPRTKVAFLCNFQDFIQTRDLFAKDKINPIVLYLILELLENGKQSGSFESCRNFLEFCKVHVCLAGSREGSRVLYAFPWEPTLHFFSHDRSFLRMDNPLLQNLFKLFPVKMEKGDFFAFYKEELSRALARDDLRGTGPLQSFSHFMRYLPVLSQLETPERMQRHLLFLLTNKRHTFSDLSEKRAECLDLILGSPVVLSKEGFQGLLALAQEMQPQELEAFCLLIAKEEKAFYLAVENYKKLPHACIVSLLRSPFAKTSKGLTALYSVLPDMDEHEKEVLFTLSHEVLTKEEHRQIAPDVLPLISKSLSSASKRGSLATLLNFLIVSGDKRAFDLGLISFKEILGQKEVDLDLLAECRNALVNSPIISTDEERHRISLHLCLFSFTVLKRHSPLDFPFRSLLHLDSPVESLQMLGSVLPLKAYREEAANYLHSFSPHEILCMRSSCLETVPLFLQFLSLLQSLCKEHIPGCLLQVLKFRKRTLPSPGTQERENFDKTVLGILKDHPSSEGNITEHADCFPVDKRGSSQGLLFCMIKAGNIRAFYTGIESVRKLIGQKECDLKLLSELLTHLLKSFHAKRACKELASICESRIGLYGEMEAFLLQMPCSYFLRVFRSFARQSKGCEALQRGVAKIQKEGSEAEIDGLREFVILQEYLPAKVEKKREALPSPICSIPAPSSAPKKEDPRLALVKKVKSQAPFTSVEEIQEVLQFICLFNLESPVSIKILDVHFSNVCGRILTFFVQNAPKKEILLRSTDIIGTFCSEEVRASVAREKSALSSGMHQEPAPEFISLSNYLTYLRALQIRLHVLSQFFSNQDILLETFEKALRLHSKAVHEMHSGPGFVEPDFLNDLWENLLLQIFSCQGGALRFHELYEELYPNPTEGVLAVFHLRLLQTALKHFHAKSKHRINLDLLRVIISLFSSSLKMVNPQDGPSLIVTGQIYTYCTHLLNDLFNLLQQPNLHPILSGDIKTKIFAVSAFLNGSYEKEKLLRWKTCLTEQPKVAVDGLIKKSSLLEAEDLFEQASIHFANGLEIEKYYDEDDAPAEWAKALPLLKKACLLNPSYEKAVKLYCDICIRLKNWEVLCTFVPVALESFANDAYLLEALSLARSSQPPKKQEEKSPRPSPLSSSSPSAALPLQEDRAAVPILERTQASALSSESVAENVTSAFYGDLFGSFVKKAKRLFQAPKGDGKAQAAALALLQSHKAFVSVEDIIKVFGVFTDKDISEKATWIFFDKNFAKFLQKTTDFFQSCDGKKARIGLSFFKVLLKAEQERADMQIEESGQEVDRCLAFYSNSLYSLHLTLLGINVEKNAGQDEGNQLKDILEAVSIILENPRECIARFWKDFLPLALSTQSRFDAFHKCLKSTYKLLPDEPFFHGLRLAIIVEATILFRQHADRYLLTEITVHLDALLASHTCTLDVNALYDAAFNVLTKVVGLLETNVDAAPFLRIELLRLKAFLNADVYKKKHSQWKKTEAVAALLKRTDALLVQPSKLEVKKDLCEEIRQANVHYEEGKKTCTSPFTDPFEKTNEHWTKALSFYLIAFKKNPKGMDVETCLRLCEITRRLQNLPEIIPILESCPRKTDAILNNLGIAYRVAKQLDKSVTCFGKAIKLSPDYIGITNLAGALFDRNKAEDRIRAIKMCHECLDQWPQHARYYVSVTSEMRQCEGIKKDGPVDKELKTLEKRIAINTQVAKGLVLTKVSVGAKLNEDLKTPEDGKGVVVIDLKDSARARLQQKRALSKAKRRGEL